MLHVLPPELTLTVLSYLPIPSLLSLPLLSRQWLDFFFTNQSAIFRRAALLHEYIQAETLLLEDALSVNTGRPWAGSTSWKDFCKSYLHHTARACRFQRLHAAHFRLEGHLSDYLIAKVVGRFNSAKIGRGKGARSRVC